MMRSTPAVWALLAMLALATHGHAAVYYLRADGGDHKQCNGLHDIALAAAGKGRNCAWQHPFTALPPGGKARIAAGDTLQIAAGSYRMGLNAPGASGCSSDWPWDCFMAALPSGLSAQQPTRLSGSDANGNCSTKPELWGAERAARVLNLDGSSHIEVSCLEITDRSSCVENHCHGGPCGGEIARCERDKAPYGDWAGTGVYARDSANVLLRDLDVHGLAVRGFHVGRVRDWTLQQVSIVGNGWSGWDGDLGEPDSSNSGRMQFLDVEIAYNGCAERYPGREPFACWGQSSGGYGDGLGTAATAGDWSFDQTRIHHNASDGLDLLYLKPPGRLRVMRSRLHGNAGNQLKASGDVLVNGSSFIGNCGQLGADHGLSGSDLCRALGNAVVLVLWPATTAALIDNEVRGAGDCLVVVEGGDASSRAQLHGNRLHGGPLLSNPSRLSCGFYAHRSSARIELVDNHFRSVRNRQCPKGNRCGDSP